MAAWVCSRIYAQHHDSVKWAAGWKQELQGWHFFPRPASSYHLSSMKDHPCTPVVPVLFWSNRSSSSVRSPEHDTRDITEADSTVTIKKNYHDTADPSNDPLRQRGGIPGSHEPRPAAAAGLWVQVTVTKSERKRLDGVPFQRTLWVPSTPLMEGFV